jgi:effector-binding domain-containing protein
MDMQNLDVEIGFPVSRSLQEKEDIKAGEMPAGKYASCIHIGPYDKLEPAYAALAQWIKENGYQSSGPAYEIYLNDPNETVPEELETLIKFPLI